MSNNSSIQWQRLNSEAWLLYTSYYYIICTIWAWGIPKEIYDNLAKRNGALNTNHSSLLREPYLVGGENEWFEIHKQWLYEKGRRKLLHTPKYTTWYGLWTKWGYERGHFCSSKCCPRCTDCSLNNECIHHLKTESADAQMHTCLIHYTMLKL